MVNDGLIITFDPSLDGGGFPGPLDGRDVVVGEAWLGPLGLIDRLQTELGLLGHQATRSERAADLAKQLSTEDGWWRRSFDTDPIATCRRLLSDRDDLAMWGWRGEPAGERLAGLWKATSGARDGLPDQLREILEVLPRRSVDISTIRIHDDLASLPPLWRQIFAALGTAGVQIDHRPLGESTATQDLAAARSSNFEPRVDGSLQLVRPHGPLAAADEVAAALAAFGDLRDVLLIGGDNVLDEAMARHGLPRIGAEIPAPASTAIVRLVIETAFAPMEPSDLHALLCIDPGPVPRRVARKLIHSLNQFPSRGAHTWREALAEGLEKVEDLEQREKVATRLKVLLDPVTAREGELTVEQLNTRLRALTTWARGRMNDSPTLIELVRFADALSGLVKTMGAARLGRLQLRRMCDEVECRTIAGRPAEVGIATISRPGAMLGPARYVVWWGFTRDAVPPARRLRLSEQERAMMLAAGVTPPDAGAQMAGEARRWRRPLLLTSDALILVCPQTDATSDAAHPHPLWDELCAAMPDPTLAARLHAPAMKVPMVAKRTRVALRPLPIAFDAVKVPLALTPREKESPSGVERLLGCSLNWALHYKGWVRPGLSEGPKAPSPLLFGTLAHYVLAQVFGAGALAADAAAMRAEQLIDTGLADLAENLSLPDHQMERASVKRAIVESAREMGKLLTATGASIHGAEIPLSRMFGTLRIEGRADLVLANPDLIIDYKWGPTTNRKKMKSGAAIQLAMYSELHRHDERHPGIAYLILNNQELLVPPGTSLPNAKTVGSHEVGPVWAATKQALDARLAQLSAGQLAAPGALEDPKDSRLKDGALHIAPDCNYCALATLCGRRGCA